MNKTLEIIFNWSEVWALLIPLIVLVSQPKQPRYLQPVIVYLWIALVINLAADIIGDFRDQLSIRLQSNIVLYNLHSVIRFICFSLFFILLNQPSFSILKKSLPVIFIIFITINFTIVEDFLNPAHISGNLLATEAYLLLIYCMTYYLSQLKDDIQVITSGNDFWIVTGLSIYVVTNFFVFLFYVPMINHNQDLAASMWHVHNAVYIILCLSIARSFYVAS
jgi:hypothetical protein